MNSEEKKFEEKIVCIRFGYSVGVYACITESGKIYLLRFPCSVVWIHSVNKQKIYDLVWHPSLEFLMAFYIVEGQHFSKLISIDNGKEVLSKKLDCKVCFSNWFGLDDKISNSLEMFDRDLISRMREDFSFKASTYEVLINANINLLALSFESYFMLYLQGVISVIKIDQRIFSCALDDRFRALILINSRFEILSIYMNKMHFNLNEILYVYKLFSILKELIPILFDWVESYKRDYIRKLLKFVRFLKTHGDKKSLIQEFSQIYYFGKISPELLHKITSTSHFETITEAYEAAQKLTGIWGSICKFQLMVEHCLALCELIYNFKSNSLIANFSILEEIKTILENLYDWSFSTIKSHFNKNLVEGWRIFTSWLMYINRFVSRKSKGKFFDEPAFETISDIGNDREIRKKLLYFILNHLEDCARNNISIYSEGIPKLDKLNTAIEMFETSFYIGLSKKISLESVETLYDNSDKKSYFPLNPKSDYLSIISSEIGSLNLYRCSANENLNIECLKLFVENEEIINCFIKNDVIYFATFENFSLSLKKVLNPSWSHPLCFDFNYSRSEIIEEHRINLGFKPILTEYLKKSKHFVVLDDSNVLRVIETS